ncbi:hypothetical protein ACWCP6_14110 [Streptomyces sp. NPDC002004]
MRRLTLTTALMVCAAASLATVAPASAAPAQPSSTQPVLVDCFMKPQVRPGDYILACGDGNNLLKDLKWSAWGPETATATGTDWVNDCQPYCAAGRFHPYPVDVTLFRPKTWPQDPGKQQFTRIRLVYTDHRPAKTEQDVTVPLADPD